MKLTATILALNLPSLGLASVYNYWAFLKCALDIFGDYSHFYNITVKNTGGTTWRGTLIDTVTGKSDSAFLSTTTGAMVQPITIVLSSPSVVKCSSATPPQRQKELVVAKSSSFTRPANASKKLNLKATQTGKGYQIQAGFK
ncbi:Uncharacterized protein HZ326_5900 [Fusarium oxysporum f. sp. albedinis]|nr:Uncharacterized protein HZ326_5900 [Fusarium oxysporum f. sp. albedinis]